MIKLVAGVLAAVGMIPLVTVVMGMKLERVPVLGKYVMAVPVVVLGGTLAFALAGALEACTGKPLAAWSARWEELPASRRRFITVIVVALATGAVVVVSIWYRGRP